VVSGHAQQFTPQAFWEQREVVESEMEMQLHRALSKAYADVHAFQLLRVDFAASYEDTITSIQLVELKQVTLGYVTVNYVTVN
jgi:hypothetical protein